MGSNWHPKKEILHSPSKNTFLGCGGRDFCVVSCCFFCEFEGVSNVEVELGRRFQDLGRWVATIFLNPGGKGVKPWHISVKQETYRDFFLKRYVTYWIVGKSLPLKLAHPRFQDFFWGVWFGEVFTSKLFTQIDITLPVEHFTLWKVPVSQKEMTIFQPSIFLKT